MRLVEAVRVLKLVKERVCVDAREKETKRSASDLDGALETARRVRTLALERPRLRVGNSARQRCESMIVNERRRSISNRRSA